MAAIKSYPKTSFTLLASLFITVLLGCMAPEKSPHSRVFVEIAPGTQSQFITDLERFAEREGLEITVRKDTSSDPALLSIGMRSNSLDVVGYNPYEPNLYQFYFYGPDKDPDYRHSAIRGAADFRAYFDQRDNVVEITSP